MASELKLIHALAMQMHAEAREAADQAWLIFTRKMSPEAAEVARDLAIASVSLEWTASRMQQALLTMIASEARAPSETTLMN
jgi:hypothetical protein